MASPPIRNWHIVISGFLQTEGTVSGCVSLWRKLQRLSDDNTSVILHSWKDNFSDLAELIWRFSPADEHKLCIKVYAYSWGGYSAILLARALQKRGLNVRALVLSDAVYRHWYLLGQWRAMVPGSRIIVPDNVREVFWFRQREPRIQFGNGWRNVLCPAGHRVVAKNKSATKVHEPVILKVSHSYMDEAKQFQQEAVRVASAA
jgi:pimeloyl-ACP methyl ester carboxylesterase